MKVNISCLVDANPKFAMQAWNWLLSLEAAQCSANRFICHTPGALSPSQIRNFQAVGAQIEEVEPFGIGPAAYCNKIQQLSVEALVDCDRLILSDADIGFLDSPVELANSALFRAKVVDVANPPGEILEPWFERAGANWTGGWSGPEFDPSNQTIANNFNGGLYIISSELIETLRESWEFWATSLIRTAPTDEPSSIHADQLGMALAIDALGVSVDTFDSSWNFPSHFRNAAKARYEHIEPRELHAIHYHSCMDTHGLPERVGVPWVDVAIEVLRSRLASMRRQNFESETFWDFRYEYFPELGSGVGSRGTVLEEKRALLQPVIAAIGGSSVLDVGCGDIEVLREAPFNNYTGVDTSVGALSTAERKRPDWNFIHGGVENFDKESYDYVISLDVLIHQSTPEEATELLNRLVDTARKGVIVSIHAESAERDGISFDSHCLRDVWEERDDVRTAMSLGVYRDVELFLLEKVPAADENKNDIGIVGTVVGLASSRHPEILLDYLHYSRERLSFFPNTYIRAEEYPWFIDQMGEVDGCRIIDLGAGVCALPLWLSERGASVYTVDYHLMRREPRDHLVWNEWGFLDYSDLDSGIASFNADMSELEFSQPFDVIYSVSVIEHMPADERRRAVNAIAGWSRRGTRILLSLDLVPNTDQLWNLAEGKVVDERDHGGLADVCEELALVGFEVYVEHITRGLFASRTDVAYVVGEFRGTSGSSRSAD